MKYFNRHYFTDDQGESLEHRATYGTANSTSNEKGTDNKKNNTSEYNHEHYMKHKDKWKGNFSRYSEDDRDFDEKNYSEANRLGDTDFYGWQREDGSWVILEEDMKFTIPAGMSKEEIISNLEAFDKEVEAKRQAGENYSGEEWRNGVQRALSSKSDEKEFDVDAAARDVIRGKYKSGAERKAALGDDYDLVQKRVNELMKGGGSSGSKKKKSSSEASEEPKSSSSTSEKKARSFGEAYAEYKSTKKSKKKGKKFKSGSQNAAYYKNKGNKALKQSDNLGSVLVSSLF